VFAVIKTGGKQYKVAANDILKVERLASEAGDVVTFDQVLMVGEGDAVTVGTPLVEGALVAGHLLKTEKQDTVIVFKKRRRTNSRRRNGHRQLLSSVRITEILTGGAKVTTQPDEAVRARAAARQSAATVTIAEPVPTVDHPVETAKPARAHKPAAAPAENSGAVEDVKLIGGLGPTLEQKLAAAGVTSLSQIAAWTEADLARYDAELELHGRAARDEWVAQAKDLIAGKPPRAKADQELAAESEAKAAAKPRAKKAAPKADKE
jgi:large subunit ribosomal protein L21